MVLTLEEARVLRQGILDYNRRNNGGTIKNHIWQLLVRFYEEDSRVAGEITDASRDRILKVRFAQENRDAFNAFCARRAFERPTVAVLEASYERHSQAREASVAQSETSRAKSQTLQGGFDESVTKQYATTETRNYVLRSLDAMLAADVAAPVDEAAQAPEVEEPEPSRPVDLETMLDEFWNANSDFAATLAPEP